jgi:hypothetical protein
VQQLVSQTPDSELLITLELADRVGLDEAIRLGRPLQLVVAQVAGKVALLPAIIALTNNQDSSLSASIRAEELLGPDGPPLGDYRVGLVPATEVVRMSELELTELVPGGAPSLLFVDSSLLTIVALP